MILTVDIDAAYLVEEKSRIRADGYFYLGNKGKIFILSKGIKAVMESSAEAECGGL